MNEDQAGAEYIKGMARLEEEVSILLDIETDEGKRLYVLPPPMAGFFEFSMMRVRRDIDQKLLLHSMVSDDRPSLPEDEGAMEACMGSGILEALRCFVSMRGVGCRSKTRCQLALIILLERVMTTRTETATKIVS